MHSFWIRRKKSTRTFLLISAALLITVTLFRHTLLCFGVETAFRTLFAQTKAYSFTYENVGWKNGKLCIAGIDLKEERYHLSVDNLSVGYSWGLFPFSFAPDLVLTHPEVTLEPEKTSASSTKLSLPLQLLGVQMTVENGVLQFPLTTGMQRLYFLFKSGVAHQGKGSFALSYDPDLLNTPLLTLNLQKEKQALGVHLRIERTSCSHITPLLAYFSSALKSGWENVGGEIDLSASALLNEVGSITHMSGHCAINRFSLNDPQQGIAMKAEIFQTDFSYPSYAAKEGGALDVENLPVWKEIFASAVLQKGEILFSSGDGESWGASGLEGKLSLDPAMDPYFSLKGQLQRKGITSPFHLVGEGYMQQDHSFWLKGKLSSHLGSLLFSVCNEEKGSYTVEADFSDLSRDQLEIAREMMRFSSPLFAQFSISRGTLSGKMAAWIKENTLAHLQLSKMDGKGVVLKWKHEQDILLDRIAVEGNYVKEGGSAFSINTLTSGKYLFAPFSTELADVYAEQEIALSSLLKFESGSDIVLEGSLEVPEKIDFAMRLPSFEKQEVRGWLRTEKLYYAPYQLIGEGIAASFYLGPQRIICEKIQIDSLSKEKNQLLQNVHCSLDVNLKEMSLDLHGLEGELLTPSQEIIQLKISELHCGDFAKRDLSFVFSLQEKGKEFLHAVGYGEKSSVSDNLILTFDPAETYFFGSPLHISRLELHRDKLSILEMSPQVQCASLLPISVFLHRLGYIENDSPVLHLLKEKRLLGEIKAKITYAEQENSLAFFLRSQGLSVGGHAVETGVAKGIKRGEEWHFDKLQVDGWSLTGSFLDQQERIYCPSCTIAKGDWKIHLGGELHKKSRSGSAVLQAEFLTPLPLEVQNQGNMDFQFSPSGEILLSKIDLICQESSSKTALARFVLPQLRYDPDEKKWSGRKSSFVCTSFWKEHPAAFKFLSFLSLEKALSGELDIEGNLKEISCKGVLREGKAEVAGQRCELQKIAVRYTGKALHLGCRFLYRQLPFETQMQLDFSEQILGMIKVRDQADAPGIKVLFRSTPKEGLIWESVEGSLKGINLQFAREHAPSGRAELMSGKLQIDFEKASQLLSREISDKIRELKLGKGYEIAGDLYMWKEGAALYHFQGVIKGKNFSLLGYQLEHLQGELEINPGRVFVKNIQMRDPSGALAIKEIKIEKDAEQKWGLLIPLVQIQNLKPCLLRKPGENAKSEKPLVIRNLSLFNLRGTLGDHTSFAGEGRLHFVNVVKRESRLFDIPLDMIKNFGLDPGLFTPVQGEIEMRIDGEKIYLTDLVDAHSEGRRAHFFLAFEEGPSYIDWKGNLHIDLKMKQEVVLKITEPFIVGIRGSLEKPRYVLQK